MTVTVRDVAEAAGVSQATAARALGGYGYASGSARERVFESARLLGYTPNAVARALVSNATMTVGVVVGDIDNPFFATAARGLTDVFDGRGYTVLLANADEDHEREGRVLDALRSRRVDGLVVVPAPGAELDQIVSLGAAAGAARPGGAGAGCRRGHGRKLRRRRAGGGPPAGTGTPAHRDRVGHRRDLVFGRAHRRLPAGTAPRRRGGIDDLVAIGGSTQADAHAAALQLLDRPDRPTAVFTANNFMTHGVLQAAHRVRALDPARARAGGLRRPRLDDAGEAAADSRLPAGVRAGASGRGEAAGPHRGRRLTAAAGAAADPADRARLLRSARVSEASELLARAGGSRLHQSRPSSPGAWAKPRSGAYWPGGWSGEDSTSRCGMPLRDGPTWSAACAAAGEGGR